ncbi:MAG: hypothetical protein ACE5EK_04880 [Nitrospinales bacterium]
MKKFAIIGCVFILLFSVVPVMAEDAWQTNDSEALSEETGFAGNLENNKLEQWQNMGRIVRLQVVGLQSRATFGSGAWIQSGFVQRIGIMATAYREVIGVWVHWTSSNTFNAIYIQW